jgi:hypothetical protein
VGAVSPSLTLRLRDRPGGVDQPDVAERLAEVAEQVAGIRVELLGEQADVVEVAGGSLEHGAGPPGLAGRGERLRRQERAQQERALLAGQAVRVGADLRAVAVDQAARR